MANKKLPDITLAILGHIDHGKSTLIGRLLHDTKQVKTDRIEEMKKAGGEFAFLLDSFEEEQKGEMTIDIFYSRFKTPKHQFTLIDNPGHLEFIKNMLTGTSQATGVILVVSVKPNEGIQSQTKRHLALVKLLGINQILVVINKMDTVRFQKEAFEKIKAQVKTVLKQTNLKAENHAFIPVSARQGENVYRESKKMPWYKGQTLYELLDRTFSTPLPPKQKSLRIFLQGSLQLKDNFILLGKIESGLLKKGQAITFSPSRETVKVLAIKQSEGEASQAMAGETIGLLIEGDIPQPLEQQIIHDRHSQPKITQEILGKIFLLWDESLLVGQELAFRYGTIEIPCRLEKILACADSETQEEHQGKLTKIEPAEMAEIRLRFPKPIAIEKFSQSPSLGRFLLFRGNKNIAAGVVLD